MSLDKYRKMYPRFPLSSPSGMVVCPVNGDQVEELTESYLNRILGAYSLEDFYSEFPETTPKPVACPMTGMHVVIDSDYPKALGGKSYTEEDFMRDFPECEAIITCPFTGKKMLGMTQEHLDGIFGQYSTKTRMTIENFKAEYKNVTIKARKAKVMNPYTGKMVDELTPAVLAASGTNVKEHLGKYAKVWLENSYQDTITCPFTGRRVKQVRHSDLDSLGRTVIEFYNAVSEFPLFRYEIQCADCGKWVENIWEHLERDPHFYAESMTMEDYELSYGTNATQMHVSNNSYFENESGDSIHVADLFAKVTKSDALDVLEIEDSLSKVAESDLDRRMVGAIRNSLTLEDVFFEAAEKRIVALKFKFDSGMTKEVRSAVRATLGFSDFDIAKHPHVGAKEVVVMIPSRNVMRDRLMALVDASDIKD
jgi:hypothetical protein